MTLGFAGGKGMIGSHLIRYFQQSPPGAMRAIVRSLLPHDECTMRCVELVHGDLSSLHDCAAFANGLKAIIYLAHTNTPITSDLHFPSDAALNLIPLLNLIEAIRTAGQRPHVIYFSSGGAVYGRSSNRVPFRESDPCRPLSSYGVQKLMAEHYLRIASLKGYLTATILRVSNAYGALLPNQRLQGLIGVTVNAMRSGNRPRIFGDPANIRDYVHLDDIARVCEAALQPRHAFSVYNVGSGVGYTVAEVLGVIAECLHTQVPAQQPSALEGADWLPDWVVLDISKASDELGWVPSIDLRSGIMNMIAQVS